MPKTNEKGFCVNHPDKEMNNNGTKIQFWTLLFWGHIIGLAIGFVIIKIVFYFIQRSG